MYNMWDEWQRIGANHMGAYCYHSDQWYILPKMDIHQNAKRLRYMVGSGKARSVAFAYLSTFPLNGMGFNVGAEMSWDPRLNEDGLLGEYYDIFFRKAAPEMNLFYDTLEGAYEEWLRIHSEAHPYGPDVPSYGPDAKSLNQFAVLPEEAADKAKEHLDKALRAAEGDKLVTRRIQVVNAIFGASVSGSKMYWSVDRLRKTSITHREDVKKVLADARQAVDSNLALAVR